MPPEIVDYSSFKESVNILDSQFVIFNEPIWVSFLKLETYPNVYDLQFTYTHDHRGFKFFQPTSFGHELPIHFQVNDSNFNIYEDYVTISCYLKKLVFSDRINDLHLDSENQSLYVASRNPSLISVVDMKMMNIIRTIELEFEPTKMALNPYNGYLYTNSYPNSKILILNPVSGIILKIISIEPAPGDHPSYPATNPEGIAFTESGRGIITTYPTGTSSTYRIRVIDAIANDSLYVHPSDTLWNYIYAGSVSDVDNASSIFIGGGSASETKVFDGSSAQIRSVGLMTGTLYLDEFATNKRSKLFHVIGRYQQFLADLNSQIINFSYLDGDRNDQVDFSYRPGDAGIVYYHDKTFNRLLLLDYFNRKTLFEYPYRGHLIGPGIMRTTTDDKYLIISDNETLYFYSIDILRKYDYETAHNKQIHVRSWRSGERNRRDVWRQF